jgi:glutamate synthase domain-containing protein 3
MISKKQIEEKIEQLIHEHAHWKQKQKDYIWTDYEKENGSDAYGKLQDYESICNQKIKLLEWVISP